MLSWSFLCGWWPFIHWVVSANNCMLTCVGIFVGWGRLEKILSWSFLCGWSRSFTWLWPRIIILFVGLAFVCPSKLNVVFSRRICEFCRTGVISHLRFRTRFSFLTLFQILYWVVAEEIQSTGVVLGYFFTYGVPYFLFFFSRYGRFDRVDSLSFFVGVLG